MDVARRAVFLLLLLCGTTSARDPKGETFKCLSDSLCRVPIASENPFTLKCRDQHENTSVYWQYVDAVDHHTDPVTFLQSSGPLESKEDLVQQLQIQISSLASRSSLISGHLKLLSPRVEDTGVYVCKDEEKILARYEVDVQDATCLHLSHASLGQNLLSNSSIDLGDEGIVEIFTIWSQWQVCDRCGSLGERKRVGFCYAEISRHGVSVGGPLPCGLFRMTFRDVKFDHLMELRIEICQEDCKEDLSTGKEKTLVELMDNIHTFKAADAVLKCPLSSIYQPVYWEHESCPITRLQLLTDNSTYSLDTTTGGSALYIPLLDRGKSGTYSCYVERNLVRTFQIMFPEVKEKEETFTSTELFLIGLSVLLLFLMILITCQVIRKTIACVIHFFHEGTTELETFTALKN